MFATAIPNVAVTQVSRFLAFIRSELAPSPRRWRATLRITLACVAASFPVMAFHLHLGLLVMILMFLVAREDTTTTLLGTVLAIVGLTIGCGGLLLTYVCFADLTWMRVLLVPTFIALGLFLNRILTIGPMGSAIGLPLALGMIVPDVIPSAEFLTRFPFYIWWAAVLGLSVNLAVQFLLNPERAQTVLAHGLISRLDALQDTMRRIAVEEQKQSPRFLVHMAIEGAADQLHLLKLASAAEPFLKDHHAQVGAQIMLVDRLVTAAAVIDEQGVSFSEEAGRARLHRISRALATWRQAILERHWPRFEESFDVELPSGEVSPMLSEMERVLHLVSRIRGVEDLPEDLKELPNALKGGLAVADAFRNPAYIQFAMKGALAGFICYLIFTLTAYQGIYTAVVTCVVCSLSTIAASAQKGALRLAGSMVGGVLGVLTLTCIFPYFDSIGGFWLPFAAVTALAAYVTVGGPSLSYGGYQIGLAFYKCVLQTYGPYTELRVVRDRLIGILLGLAVFGFINSRLWPVKALGTTRTKLASTLLTLAKLAGLPDQGRDPTPSLVEAYDLRLRAYQAFRAVEELVESSKFEPGEELRRKLQITNSTAQRVLLYLLAINQHRFDLRPEAVPEILCRASLRFRTLLADQLRVYSERIAGRTDQADQDLQGALVELEQSVASQVEPTGDSSRVKQVNARLELYRKVVTLMRQLAPVSA